MQPPGLAATAGRIRASPGPAAPADVRLDVPVLRQQNWCSCGLAAVNMAMRAHGRILTEAELEKNPLARAEFLRRHGFGPGRLGRIALSYGFDVTIVDPEPRDVGKRFVAEGGRWVRRLPTWRDLHAALADGAPPVACIPDKREAFENCTHSGSHWVTIHSFVRGDFLLHDPAPWRQATRCRPGYWHGWGCSLIVVRRRPTTPRPGGSR